MKKKSQMGSQQRSQPVAAARSVRGNNVIIAYLDDRFAVYGAGRKRYKATFVPSGSLSGYPRTVLGTFDSSAPDGDTATGVRKLNAVSRKASATAPAKEPGRGLIGQIQYGLRVHGYYSGPEDGKINQTMLTAITRFEKDLAAGRVADPSIKAMQAFKANKAGLIQNASPGAGKATRPHAARIWPNSVAQPADREFAGEYASFPEPVIYIVPAASVRSRKLPGDYDQLQRFVAARALSARQKPMGESNYVIFAFLEHHVSPTSKLDIKISKSRRGTGGFGKGSREVDFNGRKVAYMSGSMKLFDSSPDAILYIKAVFTPGHERNAFKRYPRLVGRFNTAGI